MNGQFGPLQASNPKDVDGSGASANGRTEAGQGIPDVTLESASVNAQSTAGEDTSESPNTTATPTKPATIPVSASNASLSPSMISTSPQYDALHTSRPAPVSPSPSRPSSALYDHHSSIPRDRSGSTSSSRGGRRVSSGSVASGSGRRAASRSRPKSMLGTNVTVPQPVTPEEVPEGVPALAEVAQGGLERSEPIGSGEGDGSDRAGDIGQRAGAQVDELEADTREDKAPGPSSSHQVIIRDYAFSPSDDRYSGNGVIEEVPPESPSMGFAWAWKSSRGADAAGSSSRGEASRGWGGLMGGWRGFGSRGNAQAGSTSHGVSGKADDLDDDEREEDGDEDEDEDTEDDEFLGTDQAIEYYSSPSPSDVDLASDGYTYNVLPPLPEGREPKGLYRAAYAFEALSSSEMSLTEGDLLSISGRGNGDPGWVIARRAVLEDARVVGTLDPAGLVPEAYLERVELVDE
ncbi:hypothetical protein IAU60_001444 [Kwoniella sp. DSM 27419]